MSRRFLFLQGPHGPFFHQLAQMLRRANCEVWRVGFNAGDQAFWRDQSSYIAFTDPQDHWPARLETLIGDLRITDLALYGDTRPIHRDAIAIAKKAGLRIHVFEEGYLRPYWITYERDGSNGHSRLMSVDLAQIYKAQNRVNPEMAEPPAHWGDMRQHVFYGALYHWFVLFWNLRYRHFTPHRRTPLWRETLSYTARLLLMPVFALERALATRTIRTGGFPFHIALLQLEHDANFQTHSPFAHQQDFIAAVIEGFAAGAPPHHHLVFKAHPLDPVHFATRRRVSATARSAGVADRVHFVRGGKLAQLLDPARSAVTVNSTAGQQALWRAIPLKLFGEAVYDKPEFTSDQPLARFYHNPTRPDLEAYHHFRAFLLASSQVTGGFYSRSGRRQLLRQVVDMMLCDQDPYEALLDPKSGTKRSSIVATQAD